MYDRPRHIARRLVFFVTLAGLYCLNSATTPAQRSSMAPEALTAEAVPDELLVQFKPGVEEHRRAALRAAHGARLVGRFNALHVEHLRLPRGAQPRVVASVLRTNTDVWAAQPNYIRRVSADPPPDDTYWRDGSLWGMRSISAPAAWNTFGGGTTTVVLANIDTGVNYNHPDLAANIWSNPGEVQGNGVDDDGNGYIDDVHGIDTASHDSDPYDDHGHGTHTAGTAGAVANNGIGVVGVSWNVRILPCKFMDASGRGTDAAAVECFNYVVDQKARGANVRVTNNSWGSPRLGDVATVLKSAIDAAGDAGILNVFAAGNSGTDNDLLPVDPSSFDSPSIVSVAATDEYFPDNRVFWSNYGATSVDLAAPGVHILSTFQDWYVSLSGTSMAAAHVSGAAALLFSHSPTLTVAEAKAALLGSVDVLSEWSNLSVTGGRLNVLQSLVGRNYNASPTVAVTSPGENDTFTAMAVIPLAAMANDVDGTVAQVDFYVGTTLLWSDAAAPYEYLWAGVPAGTYAVKAVAIDDRGAMAESDVVHVTVNGAPAASPYSGRPVSVPGLIEAENFDEGGAGVAYGDLTPGNSGGEYRASDVDIEPTTDTGGGYNVGWTNAREWLQYTIDVGATGTYTLEARVAAVAGGATFHIEVDGIDKTGPLDVPATGGWQVWQSVTAAITLDAGVQQLRIVLDREAWDGTVGNFNYLHVVELTSGAGSSTGGPVPVSVLIEAEDFDDGGPGVGYADLSPDNYGGEYRATDVDIEATTDTGGGYNVGWTNAGEWLQYTVDVPVAGTYTLEVRVAATAEGATFHLEVDGVDETGALGVPDTGGWQVWQSVFVTVTLQAGVQRLRVVLDTEAWNGTVGNFNYLRLVERTSGSAAAGVLAVMR